MQEYAPSDINALRATQIIIRNELTGDNGTRVLLQFPPRVTRDSKKANWMEYDIASYEPLPIWRGSGARNIGIEFDYVVDDSQNHEQGTTWDIETIANQLRLLKSYFYITIDANQATFPLVKLIMYDYAPSKNIEISTWRMQDINITPSGPIMYDNRLKLGDRTIGTSSSGRAFHLKHTVSMNLDLFTRNQQLSSNPNVGTELNPKIESDNVGSLQARDTDRGRTSRIDLWF